MRNTLLILSAAVLLSTAACHKAAPVAKATPPNTTPVPSAPPPAPAPAQRSAPAPAPQQRAAVSTPAPASMPPEVRKNLNERLARLEDALFDYDKATIRDDARTALREDVDVIRGIL